MPRPKQRTPQLRERLLEVAAAVLAHDGVPGFTTRRVAAAADTSTNAVYELFGDRGGLLRELFFEGFRRLGARLGDLGPSGDARTDLARSVQALRRFAGENRALAELMFSAPFADFDPGPDDLAAGAAVREHLVGVLRRCAAAGLIDSSPTDAAHVVLATAQGLALQEAAGWLGTSPRSIDRRWSLAARAALDGL